MKKLALFVLLIVFPTISFAANEYLCKTDKSTGFYYDKDSREWESTKFTTNKAYIVKKSDNENHVWQVSKKDWDISKFREKPTLLNTAGYSCANDFDPTGNLDCKSILGGEFFMNKINLKFLLTYTQGYYNVLEGGDTPHMEIGNCSPW